MVAAVPGCSPPGTANDVPPFVLQTLQDPGTYELLSIDPSSRPMASATTRPGDGTTGGTFRGYRVLGRTVIADDATRQALTAALRRGAQENTGMAAGCFDPRHALRVTSKGQTVDLLNCFKCLSVEAFNGEQHTEFLISDSPEAVFDDVLTAAHVPLAAK